MTWGIQYRATDASAGEEWCGGIDGQRTPRMERAGISYSYPTREAAVPDAVRFKLLDPGVIEVRIMEGRRT